MRRGVSSTALALALLWAAHRAEVSPMALLQGGSSMAEFLLGSPDLPESGFFPPDFGRWRAFVDGTLDTLAIAAVGTALSLLAALPLGVLGSVTGARLLLGQGPLAIVVQQGSRRLLDALRAVNEVVFAMLFVAAVGLGPFAGALALAVHTAGVLGKLISEAADAIDAGQIEAVEGTGASKAAVLSFAVAPQLAPHFVSYLLLRFETNVRAATVVGLTGAGGIGFELWEAIRSFAYREASAILLVIVAIVVLLDRACESLRARVT